MLINQRAAVRARLLDGARSAWLSRLSQAVLNAAGRRTLICIGDSHAEAMWLVREQRMLPKTRVEVVAVGGATASGVQNPNSRTNALGRFRPWLDELNPRLTVLACLGEVDAGFLVFARDGDPADNTTRAVDRYTEFLQREVVDRGARLIVVTVIPPIIEDYSTWAGPRGQKRDIDATWQQRRETTDLFNTNLQKWATLADVSVINLDNTVRDVHSGRVLIPFRHPDPDDHHLNPDLHAELLAIELRRFGFR